MAKFCCYLMPDCGIDPLFCYHSDVKTEVAGDHFWSNIGTMGNRELLPMAVPAVTGVELIPIGKSERGRERSFSRKIREREARASETSLRRMKKVKRETVKIRSRNRSLL